MATDLKQEKKKVTQDWATAFPQLTLYSQSKFYKITGPVVTGIELIKLPRTEEYRPHFVLYPLWKKDVKECLQVPIVLKEYYDKKGRQFSIPFEKHTLYFDEVLGTVKHQTPLLVAEDVELDNLFSVINDFSNTSPLSDAPNSYLQAKLQEAKLEMALCIGSDNGIQNVLGEIQKRKWDTGHFAMWNINFNKWLQDVREKVNHRQEFLNRVIMNKQDKKLEKVKQSELKD